MMAAYTHNNDFQLPFQIKRSAYEHYSDDDGDERKYTLSTHRSERSSEDIPHSHQITQTQSQDDIEAQRLSSQLPSAPLTRITATAKPVKDLSSQQSLDIEEDRIPSLFFSPTDDNTWFDQLCPRLNLFRFSTFLLSLQLILFVAAVLVAAAKHDLSPRQHVLFGPGLRTLLTLGAVQGRLIAQGQLYRLFVSQLLTVNVVQLLCHMLIILTLFYTFEKRWPTWRVALLYVLSGVSSSLWVSALRNTAITTTSSAAIVGVVTANVVFVVWNWRLVHWPLIELFVTLCVVAVTFVVLLSGDGIDWLALFGGCVSGCLMAGWLLPMAVKHVNSATMRTITLLLWIVQFLSMIVMMCVVAWR